jgi:hypothetical protein
LGGVLASEGLVFASLKERLERARDLLDKFLAQRTGRRRAKA